MARTFTRAAVGLSLVGAASLLGWRVELRNLGSLLTAHGPLASQPRWLQAIEMLLLKYLFTRNREALQS